MSIQVTRGCTDREYTDQLVAYLAEAGPRYADLSHERAMRISAAAQAEYAAANPQ